MVRSQWEGEECESKRDRSEVESNDQRYPDRSEPSEFKKIKED